MTTSTGHPTAPPDRSASGAVTRYRGVGHVPERGRRGRDPFQDAAREHVVPGIVEPTG
ncbi:hypothetical protein ACFU8W_50145 [Streptomyces sp. NPDC057565]|uniref:hypothetical protein n=1 Tax=Streptomyces sp. NPDC057565 TaxID=3346169 RepID=UPI00368D0599